VPRSIRRAASVLSPDMQNILPKATVLALIAGGFSLTGDLGWIADRGLRVLDAADVAMPAASGEPEAAGSVPAADPVAVPRSLAAADPVEPPQPVPDPVPQPVQAAGPPPAYPAPSAPAHAAAQVPVKPPTGGAAEANWNRLQPGSRVTVWLAAPGPRCLVLDVVEPATGEALAYEAVGLSADGRPLAAATPPRRVIVGRPGDPPAIFKGGMLHLAPAGIATAGEAGRWLGPVEALLVLR